MHLFYKWCIVIFLLQGVNVFHWPCTLISPVCVCRTSSILNRDHPPDKRPKSDKLPGTPTHEFDPTGKWRRALSFLLVFHTHTFFFYSYRIVVFSWTKECPDCSCACGVDWSTLLLSHGLSLDSKMETVSSTHSTDGRLCLSTNCSGTALNSGMIHTCWP